MFKNNNQQMITAALLIAVGIASAGYFVSQTLYKSKVALNTAEVKGLAERRVQADRAYWTIQYHVGGTRQGQIPALYEKSEADQGKIIALLKSSGFSDAEIKPGVLEYSKQEFRDNQQNLVEVQHLLTGQIEVETQQVALVATVRAQLNRLIAQGLNITNNAPAYYFTRLNAIKPDMLKEANQNARLAANEFAKNADVQVGGIRSARQGGFIIRDVGAEYGDTKKLEKDVRVVTNVTFFLTD